MCYISWYTVSLLILQKLISDQRGQTFNTMISLLAQWTNVSCFIARKQSCSTGQCIFLSLKKIKHFCECVCIYVMSKDMCDWWTWTCSIITPSSVICVIQTGIQLTCYSTQLPATSPDCPQNDPQSWQSMFLKAHQRPS